MDERAETVVIGGGQAGLCASYHLTAHQRDHLVLERERLAESWRTQRWDGFYLNTPNWALRLPGYDYVGADPDAFMPRDEVVAHLERYASGTQAPVRCGVSVESLEQSPDGDYRLETSAGSLMARNVVVATGAFQQPRTTSLSRQMAAEILQLHASEYLRPAQLPAGAVLVVGSGSSGCQIAEELARSGRQVYLSVGSCPWSPRRYRGRDFIRWATDLGLMDQTVDSLASASEMRLACNQSLSGNDGGHDCHPRMLARLGVVLIGRVDAIDGHEIVVRPGLEEALAKADEFAVQFRRQVDEHVAATRLDVLDADPDLDAGPADPATANATTRLDLGSADITSVLWANGYEPDFRWIHLDIFDSDGWPRQIRGVTAAPGLYFVGLHWLHKRKSALFLGVGEDAEYVVGHLAGSGH